MYAGGMGRPSGDAVDPRVARTRRDVIRSGAATLLDDGWSAMTHAEVARRSGYSKATVYAHWPTPLDLMRDAIARICDDAEHPSTTGNLREDLFASLSRLALTLSEGRYDTLMAGVIERAGRDEGARDLRNRLYETATNGIRDILAVHLESVDVEPSLAMLVGAVLVRATYEGKAVDDDFVADIIHRVLDRIKPASH